MPAGAFGLGDIATSTVNVPELAAAVPRAERVYLWVEFATVFFVLPTMMLFRNGLLPFFPVLLGATAGCLALLLRDRTFDRRQLWIPSRSWREIARMLGLFFAAGAVLALLVYWFAPEHWLGLPRNRPMLWALIMVAYPILSVFPQEIIWRAFLFHRYRALFTTPWAMILASAAAFGYVHILLENALAVGLTLVGGLLFAWTYHRTRSTLLVSIEHALYGCLIFTIGIGAYLVINAGMR